MFFNKNFEANSFFTLKRRGKATDVMSVLKYYLRCGDFFLVFITLLMVHFSSALGSDNS